MQNNSKMNFFQEFSNGSWHIFRRNWELEFAEGFRQINKSMYSMYAKKKKNSLHHFSMLAHCLSAAANSSHETSATVPALDRTASSASLTTTSMASMSTPNSLTSSSLPTSSNLNVDYNFIDVEYRYGFSQVSR